ncbi:uncharacterized protein [Macrobrachium rosenbergii]|uniref:uncharacterized protein isoform X1 n=2 Tax=Macrobrachium rosenbergii TaxID=79674 RepID=UPI0034D4B9B6
MDVLVFYLLVFIGPGKALVPASEGSLTSLTEEGKLQYDIIAREARMPRYGDCYQNSLKRLHQGCSHLTDEIQSRLALGFTNCYLIRFGWPVYPCTDRENMEDCMKAMDARSASVYSSMLTNTMAMCQFLQAQVWHKATSEAVQSLTSTSEAVSDQLSHAVHSAAALKVQLDSQLLESREALRSAFSEMRESTTEQRNLIMDVFDKVAKLQALLMGEFTWFYSVVFYVSCIFVILVATCTPRTISARLPLLVVLAMSLITERIVTSFLLSDHQSDTLQEDVHFGVWMIRQAFIIICCYLFTRAAVKFRDPTLITAARLEELTNATSEIKKLIHSAPEKGQEISFSTIASLAKIFDDSISSDDTYDPTDESSVDDSSFLQNLTPVKSQGRYDFRPSSQGACNPMVTIESPEAFERVVKRMELLSRRRSRSLRQQLCFQSTLPLESEYGILL